MKRTLRDLWIEMFIQWKEEAVSREEYQKKIIDFILEEADPEDFDEVAEALLK